jgi:hypothetical protein
MRASPVQESAQATGADPKWENGDASLRLFA